MRFALHRRYLFSCAAGLLLVGLAMTADGVRGEEATADSTLALSADALEGQMARVVENVLPSLVAVIGEWPREKAGVLGSAERRRPARVSVSSGFVLTGGYIVTTQSIARNATTFRIKPYRQPERFAQLIAVDAVSRLCVLRAADSTGLQAVHVAESDRVHLGSWIFVVGTTGLTDVNSTFGTVTHVPAATDDPDVHYLATNAPVAPGASGSAVLDSHGDVIGVALAAMVAPGSEGTALGATDARVDAGAVQMFGSGSSLVLPLDILQGVAAMLREHGTVSRAYLGVQWNPSTDASTSIASTVPQGAHLWDVLVDGPAYNAHLRKGDIVTYCNGAVVTSGPALQGMIQQLPAGAIAHLTVLRDGQPITVSAHLGTLPSPVGTINIPGHVSPEDQPTSPSPDDPSSR